MKKLRFLTLILGSTIIYPISLLNAQTDYYSFDFTAAEGFVDGSIAAWDPDGTNWAVWTGGTPDVTFTIDTSGTGSLIIDPDSAGFQAVKYVGFGFELVDNAYYGEVKLRLEYEVGTSSVMSGATVLPFLAIRGLNDQSKFCGVGLRQVNGSNTFNFFTNSGPIGGWVSAFSDGTFTGDEIGLAINEADLWTDGTSDDLLIRFSCVNTGGDAWVLSMSLYNMTTSKAFGTVTMDITDGDGTFTNQPHFFEMQDDNMEKISVAVHLDYLSINFAPLPDVELTTFWAGYEVDELGWVDTGTWLGYLNVASGEWVWSASLATYIYLPEGFVSESGAWTYVPGN